MIFFLGGEAEQLHSLDFGRTPERRELDYVRQTAASAETAKEVKIFGLKGFLIERYRQLAADFYAANRKLALRRAGWGALFTAVDTIGYYLAYAYIAWRTLAGEFSIGDLTFLAGSFRRLRTLLEVLLSSLATTASQALYLNDLFSFFEVKPEILSPEGAIPFPQPICQGFVFEDVGYIYPGAERWAVRHLSFTLQAGEIVALVGENGAGKTTLVKLLARLYDPDEGCILLDGRDLRDYDLDALRGNIRRAPCSASRSRRSQSHRHFGWPTGYAPHLPIESGTCTRQLALQRRTWHAGCNICQKVVRRCPNLGMRPTSVVLKRDRTRWKTLAAQL